jgi:hypothetical protein
MERREEMRREEKRRDEKGREEKRYASIDNEIILKCILKKHRF